MGINPHPTDHDLTALTYKILLLNTSDFIDFDVNSLHWPWLIIAFQMRRDLLYENSVIHRRYSATIESRPGISQDPGNQGTETSLPSEA